MQRYKMKIVQYCRMLRKLAISYDCLSLYPLFTFLPFSPFSPFTFFPFYLSTGNT